MLSCTSPQDVTTAFSRLKADYGKHTYCVIWDLVEIVRSLARLLYRACYIGMPLYVCGFVVLGAAFQKHLSVGALVMGWGITEVATMVNTVAVCEFIHVRLLCKDLQDFRPRCIHERLLPESPGRNQCATEHHPYAGRFQCRILPSSLGAETRSAADIRL